MCIKFIKSLKKRGQRGYLVTVIIFNKMVLFYTYYVMCTYIIQHQMCKGGLSNLFICSYINFHRSLTV